MCIICCEHLSGPGYGCRAGCEFGIHVACTGHPETLSSPAHHAHQLALVPTRRHLAYKCDVCKGRCEPGCALYRCRSCGFDMHPGCARHMEHDLALVQSAGLCDAYRRRGVWFYRCTVCRDLDFQVACAAAWPGQEQDGEAREEENGQYRDGAVAQGSEAELLAVTRDFEAELLRNRIVAQSHGYCGFHGKHRLQLTRI